MTEVTPEQHAARLRMIRRLQGMLYHPESAKVLDDDSFDKIVSAVHALRSKTPVTEVDMDEYGRAGARDLKVIWSIERQRYIFARATGPDAHGEGQGR